MTKPEMINTVIGGIRMNELNNGTHKQRASGGGTPFITISNRGQAIEDTNYWDHPNAQAGYFYLSWTAGAARLLVPDNQKLSVREMRSAKYVIVSRGPWHDQGGREAVELLFEDESDCPYCLHLVAEQCDKLIPAAEQGGGFVMTVWTRGGLKLRLPAKYRMVDAIPCMKEWSKH